MRLESLSAEEREFFARLLSFENYMTNHSCAYCETNISRSVRVFCVKCPNLVLCLECFRTGKELSGENFDHQKTHPYHIMDKLDFPLFTKEWSARDEMALIQGIMKCGMDNWQDISENLSTKIRTGTLLRALIH